MKDIEAALWHAEKTMEVAKLLGRKPSRAECRHGGGPDYHPDRAMCVAHWPCPWHPGPNRTAFAYDLNRDNWLCGCGTEPGKRIIVSGHGLEELAVKLTLAPPKKRKAKRSQRDHGA